MKSFLLAVALISLAFRFPTTGWSQEVSGFVTRSGSQLMLNGQPFRFSGANLDNIALGSDNYDFGKDEYYLSDFAVDDAFETLQKMGGKLARVYSAGTVGSPLAIEPALGHFNEKALTRLDYVIKSAGDHGIRVELVLVDSHHYYGGGEDDYVGWRKGSSFYEEPVVSDFKEYIATLVNRVNSYTHVAYKDDPVIFGWETTNEDRSSPPKWDNTICSYIKKLDPHHLVINGNDCANQDQLAEPDADIYVKHYYKHWNQLWSSSQDADRITKANKVFVVEEYGWDRTDFTVAELQDSLRAVENNPKVSGDMFWALRGHQSPGSYLPVPGEGGEWWALYYGGLDTSVNQASDMHQRALILQAHGHKMSGDAFSSVQDIFDRSDGTTQQSN